MTTVVINDLTGILLDWAVAQHLPNITLSQMPVSQQLRKYGRLQLQHGGAWEPSQRMAQAAPLITASRMNLVNPTFGYVDTEYEWTACVRLPDGRNEHWADGETLELAVCRAFLKFAVNRDHIDLPDGLITAVTAYTTRGDRP